MDRDALLERLRGVEWDDFEVKAAAKGVPEDAYKTVSAFANTSGGWLVFGVSEKLGTYVVTGVADPDSMQNAFVGTCRMADKFSRVVELQPKLFVVDGAQVLAFYVRPASRFEKPVRVKSDKQWQTYIRAAGGDHRCTSEEEARFLRDASRETFDEQVSEGVTMADLDKPSVEWFRDLVARRSPDRGRPGPGLAAYLAGIGVTRGKAQPTNAAALMFGRPNLIARLKPAGLVDFRVINGPFSDRLPDQRWDDRELSEANIVTTLRSFVQRLSRLVPQPFELEEAGFQRKAEAPDYRSVRESLVNLLIHQDYSDKLRTATILWFKDKAVFENPGDSFVTLSEMLDGGSSQLRNPNLARLLRQAGFADQAGTGIPSLVKAWRRAGRVPPEIVNDAGRKRYRLSLSWLPLTTKRDEAWFRLLGVEVSPDSGRLLTYAREAGSLDLTRARLATGLPGREAFNLLAALVVRRLLVVDEAGETYRVAPHLAEVWPTVRARGSGAAEGVEGLTGGTEGITDGVEGSTEGTTEGMNGLTVRVQFLLGLLERSPGLRVPALVSGTGWSRATVERVLRSLREERKVAFRGAKRTGGYFLTAPPKRKK